MEKLVIMKQSYLFEAGNFGFRPIVETDLEYFLVTDSDPEMMSFFPGGARTAQEIELKIKKYIDGYKKNHYGVFLVFDLTTGDFIARAGFDDLESGEIEVGYLVLKKHWGKGYASEILKELLLWAKNNIGKDKVIAFTPVNHIASERVMQKAGMQFVGKQIMKGVDCVIYEYKIK